MATRGRLCAIGLFGDIIDKIVATVASISITAAITLAGEIAEVLSLAITARTQEERIEVTVEQSFTRTTSVRDC